MKYTHEDYQIAANHWKGLFPHGVRASVRELFECSLSPEVAYVLYAGVVRCAKVGRYVCNINININTVILPKDIQAAHNGGFLFHKSPSRAMARGHSCASSKAAHVGSIQDGDGIWSRLQPTCCSLL